MVKAKQAWIRAEKIDDRISGNIYGDRDDIVDALLTVAADAGENDAALKKTLRRAARCYLRESRPKWVDRLMFDLCGAAVIFGGVYGIAAVINWIAEVVL